MLSSTVTVVVQVEVFPEVSVTVKVTVFSPRFEQSKSVTSIEVEAIPQLSVLPPSTSATVIEASPLASKNTENEFAASETLSSANFAGPEEGSGTCCQNAIRMV